VPWFASVPPLWLQLTIVGVWLATILLLAEGLSRYTATDSEIVRKIVHIGVGNVILLAWWFRLPIELGVGASVIFSAIAFLSYRIPVLLSLNSVGRKSLGTFFYAVSIGLLIGCFWTLQQYHHAVVGVLVMTWGDGLAALVGQRFGRHPYKVLGMPKSLEGTLTMAIVSFIVSGLVLLAVQGGIWQTWVISLAIAFVATALEAFSKFGVDNLTVPLGSAALSFFLTQLLV
jgi:phytol kinase